MTLHEILAMDTTKMSLAEMINLLDDDDKFNHNVMELRLRHEDDTGIPYEEDNIGQQCRHLARTMFPGIAKRLEAHENLNDTKHISDDEVKN